MIGYKKNLDLFLHMSRKELQQLCKQHNLPANRSHAQLAKSLASFFKKRNVRSAASVEKASNSMDKFCRYSFVTEPQATQKNNFLEESTRGGCGRFCHIGNQIGVTHMGSSTSDKPQTTLNALCSSCHGNQKGTEDFEHCNICLAADVRETRSNLGLESKEASIRSGSGKFLDSRNTEQKLILGTTRNSRTCNVILTPCGHNRPHEFSTISGLVSADEISTRSPSLQFFVMSEGGVNLYVDLNSRPLEWINSLKDDVCVYQNAEHDESRTLSKHISDSPEIDDHIKISPCTDIVMNLEDIGGEQNIGCSNSSMSSVVSENCGSEAYPVDMTVVTSGSSALTSGSIPADLSGCLEDNQVVSSSCATKSVQDHVISNVASCPIEGAQLIHDSINTSSPMVNFSASLPDASMKSIGKEDDGAINPLPIVASTPKTPCADFVDAEDNALSSILTLSRIPGKDNIPMSMEMQESVETSSSHHLNDHSGVHEGSFMLCVNELPHKVSPGGGLSSPDQLGHMVLDGRVGNAPSEVGAVDGLLYLQGHCTCGTLLPECPRSTFQDELGQRTPMRVKDTSDCSIFQTSDNSSKRSNLEFLEETRVKRQNVCGKNMSGVITNLISTKSSEKEAICYCSAKAFDKACC